VSGARAVLEQATGVRVVAPGPPKTERPPWAPGRPAVAMSSPKGKLGRPVEAAGDGAGAGGGAGSAGGPNFLLLLRSYLT